MADVFVFLPKTYSEGQTTETVTLGNGFNAERVSIFYNTVSGTANTSDYTPRNGTNAFNQNTVSFTIPGISISQDNIYEGNEEFYFDYGWIENDGKRDNSRRVYIITDEEDRPKLNVIAKTVTEGDSGTSAVNFSVIASNPAAFNYDIRISATGGSAVEGVDYQLLTDSIRMTAGSTVATGSIVIVGDQWSDPTETINITASSPFSPNATGIITILDNDPAAARNVVDDILGSNRSRVESPLLQNSAIVATGVGAGAFQASYNAYLSEIGGGIGYPLQTYEAEIAALDNITVRPSSFSVYTRAAENAGRVATFASLALSVTETVNVAMNEVARTGSTGEQTDIAKGRLTAAVWSGLAGEFVAAGVTTYVTGLMVTGGIFAGPFVVLPLVAGLAVGALTTYGYTPVFEQIAVGGIESLFNKAQGAGGPLVGSEGQVEGIRLGNKPSAPAWRYDADTKELVWLDSKSAGRYNELLKVAGVDTSGITVDGNSNDLSSIQSFLGTVGPDTITGSIRNDLILGKLGNDRIIAGGGRDLVDGGEGNDNIYGGDQSDILIGGAGNDVIDGGAGNDRLMGDAGSDTLIDWFGDDDLRGGAGDDFIGLGRGTRIIDGGDGVDTLAWSQAGSFVGQPIATALNASLLSQTATVNFEADLFVQHLMSIENIDGLFFHENTLQGNEVANRLEGGMLADRLEGLGGDDHLIGNAGSDTLRGGDGNDTLDGGLGLDALTGGLGNDILAGGGGMDSVEAGDGDDQVLYDKDDIYVDGGSGFDVLLMPREEDVYYVPPGSDFGYIIPGKPLTVVLDANSQVVEGFGLVTGFEGIDYSRLSGPISVTGTFGTNLFIGTRGDDSFEGRGGDDLISGGLGTDISRYSSVRADYTISARYVSGDIIRYAVTDTRSNGDGSDVLTSIERVRFTDGIFALAAPVVPYQSNVVHSFDSNGGAIYALYDGLLGRAPDPLGFQSWTSILNSGTSLQIVTQSFLNSPEGQIRAGSLDNVTFVEQLYESNLRRPSDPTGLSAWVDALERGVSRVDVALGFALSPEHEINLQNVLDPGIYVPDQVVSNVARLYYGLLDRAPDVGGLQNFTDLVRGGASLQDVANGFFASDEYEALSTGRTDEQFVASLYEHVLGRSPDAAGLQNWATALGNGLSRGAVGNAFTGSAEFQQRFADQSSTAYVEELYRVVLERSGDAVGVQNWTQALDSGALSRIDLAHAFTGSLEFQTRYVAPSDATFVDQLFDNALGRDPDAAGLQNWTGALAHGMSRADVAVAVAESYEAQLYLLSKIEQGWVLA